LKKYIFISLTFMVNLYCASLSTIDEQIAIIKNAPESERVELMNQFKRQLILMNQEEREKAIAQLKKDKSSKVESVERQSNDFVDGLQSTNIEQQVQLSRTMRIERHIQEFGIPNVPNEIQPSVPNDAQPSVPNDAQPSVPTDTQPSVPNETQPSVPNETQPSVPNETQPSVPNETQPSVPNETQPSVPNDAQPSVPNDVQPSVPNDVPAKVPQSLNPFKGGRLR